MGRSPPAYRFPAPTPKETLLEIDDFEAEPPPPPKRRRTTRRRFSIRAFNPWLRKEEDATNGISLDNLAEEIQLLKQAQSPRKGWLMVMGVVGLVGACLAIALT